MTVPESVRYQISMLLRDGKPRPPLRIAQELELAHETVKKACQRMARDGLLEHDGRHQYYRPPGAPMPGDHATRPTGPRAQDPSAVIADHLAHLRRRGLRPATIYQRRRALLRLEDWLHEQNTNLLDATAEDLIAWCDHFVGTQGRRNMVHNVKGFYRWAHSIAEILDVDPGLRVVAPREPARLPRPIADERLRTALDLAPEPIRTWFVLAAYCGLRACEIAPLRRRDLLLDQEPPTLIVRDGKGGKMRAVPMPELVVAVLEPYMLRSVFFPRWDDRPDPITAGQLQRHANRFLHDQGIPDTLHSLRHWYGSMTYRHSGFDLRVTQDLLGHSSPVTTALYAKTFPHAAAEVVAKLPNLATT